MLKHSIPFMYGLKKFFSQPGMVSSFKQDSLGNAVIHTTHECTSPSGPANLNILRVKYGIPCSKQNLTAHKLLSNQHTHLQTIYAYYDCKHDNN